jgi:hypothetical protein
MLTAPACWPPFVNIGTPPCPSFGLIISTVVRMIKVGKGVGLTIDEGDALTDRRGSEDGDNPTTGDGNGVLLCGMIDELEDALVDGVVDCVGFDVIDAVGVCDGVGVFVDELENTGLNVLVLVGVGVGDVSIGVKEA